MFATVFVALFVAHQVADHWVQTQEQAARKGLPGWAGRRACAAHVASYTVTAAAFLAAVTPVPGVTLPPGRVAVALAASAVTHYLADRREPLRWLVMVTRKDRFYALGAPRPGRDDNPTLGGAYALDQSFHYFVLFVASLILAY